jgi:GTP-binding protein
MSDEAIIYGRGEMQLGILLENMRREGFEFTISPPKVVLKYDDQNNRLEPMEEVIIDVDEDYVGLVMQKLCTIL